MIRYVILVALSLVLPTSATALNRLTASNGLSVARTADGIEVFAHGTPPGRDFFCAAGEFADRALGAGATDRVRVAVPLSPSARRPGQRSVIFALDPPRRGKTLGNPFLQVRKPGRSLTVGHAAFLCNAFHRKGDD